MIEAYRQMLTSDLKQSYHKPGGIIMQEGENTMPESKIESPAKPAMETQGKTVTPEKLNTTQAENNPTANLESKTFGFQQQKESESTIPTMSAQEATEEKPTQKIEKTEAEDQVNIENITDTIREDPIFQDLLSEEFKENEEKSLKTEEIQKKAIVKYLRIKEGEPSSLKPYELKLYKEELKKAFEGHPIRMLRLINKYQRLIKENANLAELQKDPTTNKKEIGTKETGISEYKKQIYSSLRKIDASPQLTRLLERSVNNTDVMKLLQSEKKKNLLKILLTVLAITFLPVGEEAEKMALQPSQ